MWLWKRTTYTNRTKRRRNDITLQEIGEGRNIIILITERKVKLIGQSLQDITRFNIKHLKKKNYGKTTERKIPDNLFQ